MYREIKVVRQNLKQLLKLNPHRVWGPPTQDTFLAKATTNLDECFKRIPVRTTVMLGSLLTNDRMPFLTTCGIIRYPQNEVSPSLHERESRGF